MALTNEIDVDQRYAVNVAFPMRFSSDGDLELDVDVGVVDQAINLIIFTLLGSFLLQEFFGSQVLQSVFDPGDELSKLLLDSAVRNSIELQEPRASLTESFLYDDLLDEDRRRVTIPYKVNVTGKLAQSIVSLSSIPLK